MKKPIALFLLLVGSTLYSLVPGRATPPAGDIDWRTDAERALKEVPAGKPTLIVFSAGWCPPCQKMKSDTWPQPEVARSAGRYNTIWADIDNQPAVARKFGVQSVPTVIKLDQGGNVRGRLSGFVPASSMAAWLDR
jgi:thioredoxin-like negative regulator of GroEL